MKNSATAPNWLQITWRIVENFRKLLRGWVSYIRHHKTPDPAYQCMITLHCLTRGWSNEMLHTIAKAFLPKYRIEPKGVLGVSSESEVENVARGIRRDGYHQFSHRLPASECEAFLALARRTPARLLDGTFGVYNAKEPLSQRYSLTEVSLIDDPHFQKLMCDSSILAVAQRYLGCAPVLASVGMWWSPIFGQEPNDDAAQMYHFDMERIKWLKFFVYLTDVTRESGPHCFIKGSHRAGGQPKALLRRRYERVGDDEMAEHYPPESFLEFVGPRGTIIAEDTRGFHKGRNPMTKDRCVLELEFCDSLFGAAYVQQNILQPINELREAKAAFPRTYAKYFA
ncbi:MAG: phytanoyl-CoA dioxygenase family protein [Deltaproteobacteria bacterium]|nr:phytanoyl-CoA dioxygenase family protein [Deltaproteobacteria bacterium]